MNTQDHFKLGSWLSNNTTRNHHWGVWDCNIFFVEYHDMMYGTDDLKRITNRYWDKKSGIKLLREFNLTPRQWLTVRGYKQTNTIRKWKTGDLATIDHKLYYTVYVWFNGAFWTVQEGKGLVGVTPQAVQKAGVTWWRKDG